nr:hypothetical protein [Tanacetum cinerariifolium]
MGSGEESVEWVRRGRVMQGAALRGAESSASVERSGGPHIPVCCWFMAGFQIAPRWALLRMPMIICCWHRIAGHSLGSEHFALVSRRGGPRVGSLSGLSDLRSP